MKKCDFMKRFYFLFVCVFYANLSMGQSATLQKEQPITYMQFLLSQPFSSEDYELNCSNIVDSIYSYFEISETYRALLAISAERLKNKCFSEEKKNIEEVESVKTDIRKSLFLMQKSDMNLMDQAQKIKSKLSQCLKG